MRQPRAWGGCVRSARSGGWGTLPTSGDGAGPSRTNGKLGFGTAPRAGARTRRPHNLRCLSTSQERLAAGLLSRLPFPRLPHRLPSCWWLWRRARPLWQMPSPAAPFSEAAPGLIKLARISVPVGCASNHEPLTWAGDPGPDFTWHGAPRPERRTAVLHFFLEKLPHHSPPGRRASGKSCRVGAGSRQEGWGLRKLFCEASLEHLPLWGTCSVRNGGGAARVGGRS